MFVAHGDGKARERLVAKAESYLATGPIVAQWSPTAIFLFFFFILLHGDGISCRHFVAKDDGIFLFFNLMRGDGSVYRHLVAMFGFIFGFIFFKNGRQSLWYSLVAMFLNLNLKVAMGL